jgi:hypothetical protein
LGLQHDFLLLDRNADGEWELGRFHHDPRAVHLHDDLVRYMGDTLTWVSTVNPARREPHRGLCMWGPTLIEAEGAAVAERVFGLWAELFAVGPPVLSLTGAYSWVVPDDAPPTGERVTQLEGGYDRLEFDRDEVVGTLRQLAVWCSRVRSGDGRLYLYHFGV